MVQHEFTQKIIDQIAKDTQTNGKDILVASQLLEYINIKTKSANRGSKSRGSFANLYAIYVLLEDYINVVFNSSRNYSEHEGAIFSDLFRRQRELPFGNKLQNHALNHRLNEEFHKYFPSTKEQVIIRDIPSSRYWINQNLLKVTVANKEYDISRTIVSIINLYMSAKRDAFESFISTCEELQKIHREERDSALRAFSDALEELGIEDELMRRSGMCLVGGMVV